MTLYTPTMIFDGIFTDPDKVREFALSQKYFISGDNTWPGERSDYLHEINPVFFHNVMDRIIKLLYNSDTPIQYNAQASFQIIDGKYGDGWVHHDGEGSLMSAIIFLTPGSTSGTSIFKFKNPVTYNTSKYLNDKTESIRNKIPSKSKELHNSNFEETVSVKGEYNRMVLFDSQLFHAAHQFFGNTKENSRLTLVVFIKQIASKELLPALRLQKAGNGI